MLECTTAIRGINSCVRPSAVRPALVYIFIYFVYIYSQPLLGPRVFRLLSRLNRVQNVGLLPAYAGSVLTDVAYTSPHRTGTIIQLETQKAARCHMWSETHYLSITEQTTQ